MKINLDWFINCVYAPLLVNYNYNVQIDNIFKSIDFNSCTLIESCDHYCQIYDEINGTFIKFWSSNCPYAVACEGKISLTRIDSLFTSEIIFEWQREYRPSRYQMGRIARYLSILKKNKNSPSKNENKFILDGPFLKIDEKFYEHIELSKEEWEIKYAHYLLKKS